MVYSFFIIIVILFYNSIFIIVKGNKQTKEEKAEKARIRKQNQRERQKQIYGDEEYKKMKAKELLNFVRRKRNKFFK
jgi:sortase (surface protein transpeptidase)